jgi:hypothetical protein
VAVEEAKARRTPWDVSLGGDGTMQWSKATGSNDASGFLDGHHHRVNVHQR